LGPEDSVKPFSVRRITMRRIVRYRLLWDAKDNVGGAQIWIEGKEDVIESLFDATELLAVSAVLAHAPAFYDPDTGRIFTDEVQI
jgi:hypothetical protein